MSGKFPLVEKATQYARKVVAGKLPACRYVKLACQRHLDDLVASRAASFKYRFDPAKAERKLRLIQLMPHTKGEWAFKRQLVTLEPWQLFGLAREDVLDELKKLSLKGHLIMQAAGDVVRISWKQPSMEALCDALSQR